MKPITRSRKLGIATFLLAVSAILYGADAGGPAFDPSANLLKKWRLFGKPENTLFQPGGVIACECKTNGEIAGVTQSLDLNQEAPAELTFVVESKAQEVTGPKNSDFGVYADLVHTDGSRTYGVSLPCAPGTHDWEKVSLTHAPAKPVRSISFYLLMRKRTGAASFRNAALFDASKPQGRGGSRPNPVAGGPRLQATVPAGFKEVPFQDAAPLPAPTAEENARGYLLFTRSINQPIYSASKPLDSERVEALSAFATPGEYEPVQFAVHPLRDMKDFRVTVSELKGAGGAIAAADLDLRLVTEWNIRFPLYTSKTYQRMPELMEAVTAHSFAKGQNQRYWLRIHVPSNAAPGLYRGAFTLSEGASTKTVALPFSLRVMPFQLRRDPAKRYSAYFDGPDRQYGEIPDALLDKAMDNELDAMRAYGIDMFPTLPIRSVKDKDGSIVLSLSQPAFVDRMVRHGFQGPIPILGGIWPFYNKHVPTGKIGSHWAIDTQPSDDAIYKEIESAFRKFRLDYAGKGWPEFICCPLDEVAPESALFAAKVNAAIRASGMKTYITKDPTAVDAPLFRKLDAVDAWCSQPFAMPFEKILADKRCEYWSYPNHNAGELKDRVIMQKGGRVTYGFGLWRSGYTTLIPWHWRWFPDRDDSFDYLRHPTVSGCGNRMDEQGHVIPAVYWECFREGYDDARYLYTLQQAIVEREGAVDEKCRASVAAARELLQKIWDSTTPQEKYLSMNLWPDDQFAAMRWRLATATQELLRFPAVRKVAAPSVLVDTKKPPVSKPDALALAEKAGLVESRDLGGDAYSEWKAVNTEVATQLIPSEGAPSHPLLRMTVKVDYKTDGGGENGKYPIGWPRIRREFAPEAMGLSDCDFLLFHVRVDSDRDEVADDSTPFIVAVQSHVDGVKIDIPLDLGDRQRVWLPMRIPIRDLILRSGRDASMWRTLKALQFVVSESHYRDGTRLQFDLDQVRLVKLTQPVLESVECADTLVLPMKTLDIRLVGMGLSGEPGDARYQYALAVSAQGKVIAQKKGPLGEGLRTALDVSGLALGAYSLETSILDRSGKVLTRDAKRLEAIAGYAP